MRGLKLEDSSLAGRAVRLLAPLLLVPLDMAYCHVRGFFADGHWAAPLDSLDWAAATILPWSIATMLFLHMVRREDDRARAVRIALLLAFPAYLLGGIAVRLMGADGEYSFYTRMPCIAVAVLAAALYAGRPRPEPRPRPMNGDAGMPIAPSEIVFASAAGNYVELHGAGRSLVWRQTMQNAERILARDGFVRVHRRYLVPHRSIETVQHSRKGPVEVALRNGHRIPVSNRYAANLRQ